MTYITDFKKINAVGPIGSYFKVGDAQQLKEFTSVKPSVVIPRQERLFTVFGLRSQYKPQRELGLFSDSDKIIKKGTRIGAYEGFVVDWKYLTQLDETSDYVVWLKGSQDSRVGILGDNRLKMANHQPISRANMVVDNLVFYAARDIHPSEEMTWSYDGSDNEFDEMFSTRDILTEKTPVQASANPGVHPA